MQSAPERDMLINAGDTDTGLLTFKSEAQAAACCRMNFQLIGSSNVLQSSTGFGPVFHRGRDWQSLWQNWLIFASSSATRVIATRDECSRLSLCLPNIQEEMYLKKDGLIGLCAMA